jgi:iron complex transport system substrate-binding protein
LQPPEPRIVSLIASATEIVHALGLGPFLVGRSHECDYPAEVEKLPVCTAPRFDCSGNSGEIDRLVKQCLSNALSVYEVFDDVLEALQPTHILTQTQCEVCAVSLKDVERSVACRLASKPRIVALEPNALSDIWEDMRRVADAVGISAEPSIQGLQSRMRAISAAAYSEPWRPRVACIEWLEPLMAAGNWVPELVEMIGAVNLFGAAGKHSPWMTFDELAASDPDVILVMPCGYGLAQARAEMHWLEDKPEWTHLRAVAGREVYLLDGNQYLNRPGPRVVESLQILAEILYPEQFEPMLGGGVGWERRSA